MILHKQLPNIIHIRLPPVFVGHLLDFCQPRSGHYYSRNADLALSRHRPPLGHRLGWRIRGMLRASYVFPSIRDRWIVANRAIHRLLVPQMDLTEEYLQGRPMEGM